jgi:hypothetical protein
VVERSSEVNYTLPVPQVTLVEMWLIYSELSVCDRIGHSAVKTLGVHLGIDFGALLLPYVCGVGGEKEVLTDSAKWTALIGFEHYFG